MLRDGRSIRIRTRSLRDLHAGRRTRAATKGSPDLGRDSDHRRRLQLPRTNRAGHRPSGVASGAGAPDGAAAAMSRYRTIAEYAIIGDTRSAALISLQGSIDWLCWPRFDSRSIFGRILDHDRGGYFSIQPAVSFQVKRRSLDRTNVLETTFETESGVARLLDLMPVMREEEKKKRLTPFRQLLRRVEVTEGQVPLVAHFEPRPDYARTIPKIQSKQRDIIYCDQGATVFHLRSEAAFSCADGTAQATFTLRRGERRYFALGFDDHAPAVFPNIGAPADEEIDRTIEFWREWSSNCTYDGPHADRVLRSALVLKLLSYAPSGAIVAAPTTSLPEQPG